MGEEFVLVRWTLQGDHASHQAFALESESCFGRLDKLLADSGFLIWPAEDSLRYRYRIEDSSSSLGRTVILQLEMFLHPLNPIGVLYLQFLSVEWTNGDSSPTPSLDKVAMNGIVSKIKGLGVQMLDGANLLKRN